ncbi:5'-nucleotidase C-terminal domain-containing protein [Geomicrobium sediminis]|uniref:5'-nucleotidase n=1 Tax=Geomicrobium sediminis TaxID=1347788 RepID=A0ABS2PIJ7_9BACL|nr:5'-nucleotidase C-terminal domain-containing protein [Geomicrobium sediminis]MBM7635097.1 5'-nucleotidase [Geomicrobium sediminis]
MRGRIVRYSKVTALAGLALTATLALSSEVDAEQSEVLKILHTNDIHATFDNFGKAAGYIDQVREEHDNVLYLDAGDYASGNPVVDLNYGIPMIEAFNEANLDVLTIGNHEFDYGQDHLINNMDTSTATWLGANVDTGETGVDNPEPYTMIDLDGVSVAVLGITQAPPATAPANVEGMSFDSDYAAVAAAYEEELTSEADVIIALTHIGYNEDRQLAEDVDYFDVIIGGHSHTTLNSPQIVNGTPIVQTGSNLNNLGELTLAIENNEVTEVDGTLIPVADLDTMNEDVQAVIDHYNSEMDEVLGEVIGYSENGLSRDGRFQQDAPLGNFWTDAMREWAEADVAFTNNGGIRDSIPSGDVTLNEIYTIEPFANEIMTIEMTGEAIRNVLEYSYSRDGRNQIDLQVSGMEYEILTGMTGQLSDVNMTINGSPLEDEETYTVAVADYIGTGGSGYEFEGEVLQETVGFMTDAMTDWARMMTDQGETLDYASGERISITIDPSGPIPGTIIGSTETGLYSQNKSFQDVGLGNLYTDSILDDTDADFAFLNASSVTGQIPPGEITDEQIEALDGFGNEVVVVETTGERIEEVILEQSNYHQGVDLQVSGLSYTLIPEESGSGFESVDIVLPDGSELEDDEAYVVAYNDFMHSNSFYNLGELIEEKGPVWQKVVDYVTEQSGPINYEEGSRITIEGQDVEPDPTGTWTVAEALQNNQGERAVRGYIIGSIQNNEVVLGEGEHAPSNLLLADDPNETDRSNMLPVQLVNQTPVRNGLNLVDHPDHLQKEVVITGSLERYFGTPGMRDANHFAWVEEDAVSCQYDTWQQSDVYTKGDRVTHNDVVYEAKWWTVGENPENSSEWDVWQVVADCQPDEGDGYKEWSQTVTYTAGDRVWYEGELYEAKWWTRGENPSHSGEWDVWKKVS